MGYEDFYLVSNLGRVKRKDRVIPYKDGRLKHTKSKLCKQCLGSAKNSNDTGYYQLRMTDRNKKSTTKLVHRLVAEAFIDNKDDKPTVNHKDGNKLNNCVDNLEWATYSEQQYHAFSNNLRTDNRYVEQYDLISKVILNTYISLNEAGRENNVNYKNIHLVCSGERKSCGGYGWKYKYSKQEEI